MNPLITMKPAALLLPAIAFFMVANPACAHGTSWRSPDGAIAVSFPDGWVKGTLPGVKEYDSASSAKYLRGSFHHLYVGGLIARRYITFQVAQMGDLAGAAVPKMVDALGDAMRKRGFEIVRTYSADPVKGYIRYRFLHTGDPVSQYVLLVGAETGIFYIEITAPRQDEARLEGEALQLLSSVHVLRPVKG